MFDKFTLPGLMSGEGAATNLESADIWGDANNDVVTDDLKTASADEIKQRIRLLDNDIRVMRSETQRLNHEVQHFHAYSYSSLHSSPPSTRRRRTTKKK